MSTYYVAGRRRFAVAGAAAAAFLFGCFSIGVFSCRDPVPGIALIAALFCLVVYLTEPQRMVLFALFFAFASLPASLHVAADFGVVTIYLYQVATLLAAIYFLLPVTQVRRSSYILPAMFLAVMVCYAVMGFAVGNPPDRILREFLILFEMVSGFVLAMLIIDAGYVKETMWAIAATLWFSAGMLVASSFHLVRLAGRTEPLERGLGAGDATRLVTNSQNPAICVLTALVAAAIVSRVRPAMYLVLAPPALIIALLAFARHTVLLIGVAGVAAFIASLGWHTVRRTARAGLTAAATLAVTIFGSLLLLKHSSGGAWLSDQFTTYNNRVLHNISSNRFAMDPSILSRQAENTNLRHAIAEAPVLGHGLGYPYQLPFGAPNSFEATLGTTFAHNFYLWWLAKAGAVGMTAFALLVLVPIVRGLLSASAPAKIAAALGAALLANCTVDPIPESPSDALVLGLALGAALQFAVVSRRARRQDNAVQRTSPSGLTGAPAAAGTPP